MTTEAGEPATNGHRKLEGDEAHDGNKKAKTDVIWTDVISQDILNAQEEFKEKYAAAKPYPHGVLTNVFEAEFISAVREEIKQHSKVNFKESDLFKVYQSIDLANLTPTPPPRLPDVDNEENGGEDDVADKNVQEGQNAAPHMPTVLKLRHVLYSQEWRHWVEKMCGLEPDTLTDKVDCACNCHAPTCHLLCHDDVIGTRKVSYILYLTDDPPTWSASEGGALELYGSTETPEGARIPDTVPSTLLLPVFNTMAFFQVLPGHSFHAVQEVWGERPRLSLQGWYHAASPPEGSEKATLQQLKTYSTGASEKAKKAAAAVQQNAVDTVMEEVDEDKEKGEEEEEEEEEKESPPPKLANEDVEYLIKFLHETYLTEKSMADIRDQFEDESSVQLRQFLSEPWAAKLSSVCAEVDKSAILATDKAPAVDEAYYKQGEGNGWALQGPSHMQRYLEYTEKATGDEKKPEDFDNPGDALAYLQKHLLQSEQFGRYLSAVTSLGSTTDSHGKVRRFRRGLDYTVAHYGLLTEESVLDATLCFVAGKGEEVTVAELDDADDAEGETKEEEVPDNDAADVEWQSGECGGFECYIAVDDEDKEGKAADEYNPDDDTELLSVQPCNNTLSLVYRDPGTMRFAKYVSQQAPSSRWDIAMEYTMKEEEKDE